MHSLLKAYLGEAAGHLAGLPAARRADELREMRAHLENAVIAGRELGRTEEEAVQDALAQFGTPEALGENLVQTWRREQMLNKRSLFGAAACTVVMTVALARITSLLMPFLPQAPAHELLLPPYSLRMWAEWVVWLMPLCLIVGGVSGLLFPRRAATGVVFGMDVFLLCFLMGGSTVTALLTSGKSPAPSAADNESTLLVGFSVGLVLILGATAASWAVSRGRKAGQRRRHQAAAK